MNFKEYIDLNRRDIFSRIMEYLPIREPAEHYRIVREYSERQGSYRRPALLMLAGEIFSATKESLLLPAAAMQLSEDWILIHDDIEDNSDLRRGKPALHKLYGCEIAINAGDAAHIAMWKMLKDYMSSSPQETGNRIFEKFYDMLDYTVVGQYLDTNFIYNTKSLGKASEELYFKIAGSKTCYYSVYGPMQIGAIAAGQDDSMLGIMRAIGEPAGIAFQIMDDVLDMTADEKAFGKKRYGDLYEGKLTLIAHHAYSSATPAEKERMDSIYTKRREQKTQEDIGVIVDMIDKYGGIEYAKSIAEGYCRKAKDAVEKYSGLIPDNEYAEVMLSAIEELYSRQK